MRVIRVWQLAESRDDVPRHHREQIQPARAVSTERDPHTTCACSSELRLAHLESASLRKGLREERAFPGEADQQRLLILGKASPGEKQQKGCRPLCEWCASPKSARRPPRRARPL